MAAEEHGHELVRSESVYNGRVISVFRDTVTLPDGRRTLWERVRHPGAVGIVPLTDEGAVIMVRQFRNAVNGALLEIPAGKLDAGESPETCAGRELVEEVNVRAGRLVKLAEFYNSPGYSDEYFHLYLARDLVEERGETEPDEFLEIERIRLDRLTAMIAEGKLVDAKSIIGIALTRLLLMGEVAPLG